MRLFVPLATALLLLSPAWSAEPLNVPRPDPHLVVLRPDDSFVQELLDCFHYLTDLTNLASSDIAHCTPTGAFQAPAIDPAPFGLSRVKSTPYIAKSTDKDAHLKVSLISEKDAKKVFAALAARKDIPFGYPEDGCYARAQAMARHLDAMGLTSIKIFVEGDLKVATQNSPKGYVEWWFHVAPAVLVRTSAGKIEPEIFDPSIFDHPVPEAEWVAIQTGHNPKQMPTIYYRTRFIYTASQKDFDGVKYDDTDLADQKSTMSKYLKIEQDRNKNGNPKIPQGSGSSQYE